MIAGETSDVAVAFLGTGIMGAPMAVNLARAGVKTRAWNRTQAKAAALTEFGVEAAATARDAAAGASLVVVMVSDGAACEDTLFGSDERPGVAGVLAPGAVVIVMSSIPIEAARMQAEKFAAQGVGYIDAPVSGGERGAIDASLTIMAGGSREHVERAMPVLSHLGTVTHVGPVGGGQIVKLANQLIVGVTIAAVAEALLLIERAGGSPKAAHEALRGGFADSRVLREHGVRMLEGDYAPGAHMTTQLKDLRSGAGFALSLGLRLPLLGSAARLFEQGVDRGDGALDHSAILLTLGSLNAV